MEIKHVIIGVVQKGTALPFMLQKFYELAVEREGEQTCHILLLLILEPPTPKEC